MSRITKTAIKFFFALFKKRASSWNCLYFDWSIVYIWPWSKSENTWKKLDEMKCTNIKAYIFHFELNSSTCFAITSNLFNFCISNTVLLAIGLVDLIYIFRKFHLSFFLLEWVWLCHFISRFSLFIPYIHIETITNVLHDWIFRCMKKRKCKQPFIIHSNNKHTANNRIWNTTN